MSIYILVFLLGSVVASFLNVVAKSVPINQNWKFRRSTCPHCQATITPLQLIPILSYIAQKGRCKSCHIKISPLYPLVEFIGGLLFTSTLIFLPNPHTELIFAWIFFSLLLTVTLTDLYYRLIPNKILITFGIPLFLMQPNITTAIAGFLFLYGASFLGKILFKKETIGGGDIKLYFIIGLALPIQTLLLSIVISSVTALIHILIFAKSKSKPIPFVPFIATGTIVSYIISAI